VTVPLVSDRPVNVWLGFALIALHLVRVAGDILMTTGKRALFAPHVTNA
jgi:hypothetical protein